jgi:hypothetical protein
VNRFDTALRTSLSIALIVALAACGPRRDFDTAPSDATTTADMPASGCTAPLVVCNGACVNPQTDSDHCGACGTACPAGQACVMGACTLHCPLPEAVCGGLCSNPMTDRANCGACGIACATGLVCSMGHCTLECGSTLTMCAASGTGDAGVGPHCADTQIDRHNCGACGHECPAGEGCAAGSCTVVCPAGQTLCSGECVDVTTNPAHCGACGAACPGGQSCVAGSCSMSCPTGQMFCTDRCLDVQNDRANCGACGMACADGELCVDGACSLVCPMDRVTCSMRCVDTNTDRTNCGACGMTCASGETCTAGVCQPTCATGTTACSGACVDLTNDRSNCGACGTTCAAGEFCVGGRCGASCLPGQTVCGGVCVDTNTDTANCGYCGGTCGTGYACLGGYCRPLVGTDAAGCTAPSVQCGPICTDPRNDNNNCGACGTVCSTDRTCVTGMCVAPCRAGEIRCGTACTNIQFDRNNCGACGNACPSGMGCISGACAPDPTFRIGSLSSSGCTAIEVGMTTGGDASGIAVSLTKVLLNGASRMGLFSAADLSMPTSVSATHETLTSDLRTGTPYVLLDSSGAEPSVLGSARVTITQLAQIDGMTGAMTSTRIALSQPIPLDDTADLIGIFGGFGRIIVHGGSDAAARWWMIRMPTGEVVPLAMRAAPTNNSSFASITYTGIAEFFDGEPYVVYVKDSTTIARYRISDGTTTPIGSWTDLGDMGNITFSPVRNRWYFHHSFESQFRPFGSGDFPDQTLGWCPGTFEMP